MEALSEIKRHIRAIAGHSAATLTAQVKSVEGETCTVLLDGLEISDVRLRAVINGEESRMLVTPKAGSYVILLDNSDGNLTELAVVSVSEVEKIEINTDADVVFNGGGNGGIIKINELTDKLNDLVDKFNNHIHTTTATVGTGSAGVISKTTTPADSFAKSDYEDDKVKH